MSNEVKLDWGGISGIVTTNLQGLADGNLWQSGLLQDGEPSNQIVRISYEIYFTVAPTAGDSLRFYIANGDEHTTKEIWDAGITAPTSGIQISAAATKAAVKSACFPVWEHAWQTSHGTGFFGHFDVWDFGPRWQVLVEANGEALTSAANHAVMHYRYGTPQGQG